MDVIQLENISKKYKETIALENIDLKIESNRIYGLIGVNGAGKSTLVKIITGNIFPTKGSIKLFNKSFSKELIKSREHISATIETPSFYSGLTAEENIRLACIELGIEFGMEQKEIFQQLEIMDSLKKKAKNLSLGTKQKLGLGIAFLKNPDLLILDEPTNGIDPISVSKLRRIFRDFIEKENKTILISSHILTELYQIATDFIFIDKGKIIQVVSKTELTKDLGTSVIGYRENIEEVYNILKIACPEREYRLKNNTLEVRGIYSKDEELEIIKKLRLNNCKTEIKRDNLETYMIKLVEGDNEELN